MPITFITYAAGMLALAGVIPFAGFWSKDGILEAAFTWKLSNVPFFMLVFGALLTAFYMTRQVSYVFFGYWRGHKTAHESPAVMTMPLVILALFAGILGFFGTPAWPWFRAFLEGHAAPFEPGILLEPELAILMGVSTLVVMVGIVAGWRIYGEKSPAASEPDALEKAMPGVWKFLSNRMYVDELYEVTFIRFYSWWGKVADVLDRRVWGGAVAAVMALTALLARINRSFDTTFVNGGFDKTCEELATSGGLLARVQSGRVQSYLRILAAAVVALAVILVWSSRP